MLKKLIQRIKDYFWYESEPQTGGWRTLEPFRMEEKFLCIDDISNKSIEEIRIELQHIRSKLDK